VSGPEPLGQWTRGTQIKTVHSADHQIGRLQSLFAQVVGPMLSAKAVVLAVELGHHASAWVEQIADAQQVAVEVEYRDITSGLGSRASPT